MPEIHSHVALLNWIINASISNSVFSEMTILRFILSLSNERKADLW